MPTITGDSFFDWIIEIIQGVSFFRAGTNYVLLLLMVLVVCVLISPRKPSNVKVLAFPVMIGFTVIGLPIPLLFLGLGAIVFVMETLSLQAIGGVFEAVGQKITDIRQRIPLLKSEREAIKLRGMREEIQKEKVYKSVRKARGEPLSMTDAIMMSDMTRSKKDRTMVDRIRQRKLLEEERRRFFDIDE